MSENAHKVEAQIGGVAQLGADFGRVPARDLVRRVVSGVRQLMHLGAVQPPGHWVHSVRWQVDEAAKVARVKLHLPFSGTPIPGPRRKSTYSLPAYA